MPKSVLQCVYEKKFIGVEVYFSGDAAKKNYERLLLEKSTIEAEIGATLDWQKLSNKIATRIILKYKNVNIEDIDDWKRQHLWIKNTLKLFHKVFLPRIQFDEYLPQAIN